MKDKTIWLAPLTIIFCASFSASAKGVDVVAVSLSSPKGTLSVPITKASGLEDPDQNIYFDGVRACAPGNPSGMAGLKISHIGKCLFFHTQFAADRWSAVPVERLSLVDAAVMKEDLRKIYEGSNIEVQQDETEKYPWGSVFKWSTKTSGSAHYLYISNPKKNLTVRIGPIAGSVLHNYRLDFKNTKWKVD